MRERVAAWAGALSYGVSERVDVSLSVPYSRVSTSGAAGDAGSGFGDLALSLKWRWFDHDRVSLA
jgi:hypothetical protein